MTEWYRAADVDELTDGMVKLVVVGDRPIALARHAGAYRALDGRCPHAGGPLAEGSVEDGKLVCPWHGREYELETGRCEGYTGVATYPVDVRSDGVFVAA